MRPLQVLVIVLVLPAGLAGCLDDEEDVLLQDTAEIGIGLYTWIEASFMRPGMQDYARRIQDQFDVPPDVGPVRVSYLGDFVSDRGGSTYLNITGSDGTRLLTLHAEKGGKDDEGTIGSFWTFDRVLDLPAGTHDLTLWGFGDIGHVAVEIDGIPGNASGYEKTFEVTHDRGRLDVDLQVRGWGETPQAILRAPDGTAHEIVLEGPDGTARASLRPAAGTYRLEVDTTGWAGQITARIVQS